MIRASRRSRCARLRVGQLRPHDLEGHVPTELAVARGIDDAHAAASHLVPELVPRTGKVRPLRDIAQVVEDPVAQRHQEDFDSQECSRLRAELLLVAVISRSFSSTAARSSRRAQCR